MDIARCESAFEEWVATWNQFADTTAGITNANRTGRFQEVHRRALDYYENVAVSLRSLRSIYLHIAEQTDPTSARVEQQPAWEEQEQEECLPVGFIREDSISELLPINWKSEFVGNMTLAQGGRAARLMQLLVDLDAGSVAEYNISWLELVGVIWVVDSRAWDLPTISDERLPVQAPVVAEQLRLLRRTGIFFLRKFGLTHLQVFRLSGVPFGYCFPIDGIRVGISLGVLQQARDLLKDFAGGRLCRSVADLERRFQHAP